jgi:hypothetical protein
VRLQNQTGPYPNKWDKTGLIVEVRQFDQYVVRVDGSGRVTLRNRKFLRKYAPVIPRDPLLMLPGPVSTPSDSTQRHDSAPLNKQSLQPLNPDMLHGSRPLDTPTSAEPPALQSPPCPAPSSTPHPALPAGTSSPRCPNQSQASKVPREQKNLESFNRPGLTEQPLGEVDLPTHGYALRPRVQSRQSQ